MRLYPLSKKTITWGYHVRWYLIAVVAAGLALLPVGSILLKVFSADQNIWPHLSQTVLPIYLKQTATLLVGVGFLTLFIGVSTAYWVARFDFVGRWAVSWLLVLPFAVPTYLVAYVYTDLLEYAGPVQKWIRTVFDYQNAKDYHFFEIRSMGGAIVTMSFVLYPYVYLLSRAAFLEQSYKLNDTSQILGNSRVKTLLRVTLPLARPAIIVGVTLVFMEVLSDYGAVHHFAIQTFSEGIYDYWLGRDNIEGASQIALSLLIFVGVLIFVEQYSRKQQTLFQKGNDSRQSRRRLTRGWGLVVLVLCLLPVVIGFIVPLMRLLYFTVVYFDIVSDDRVWVMAKNTLLLSFVAAFLTVLLALFVAYARRVTQTYIVHSLGIISGLGYSIPGAVLAIGVLVPFGFLDRSINELSLAWFGQSIGLIFSGTIFIIIVAYMIRFMAVAQGSVYASLQKITPSMDDSARSLGCGHAGVIRWVHLPLIKKGVLTAALVVFVDSMKELPATLILRPFNFDTLATHIYQFASDELLEETSLAALLIIVAGLVPVLVLNRSIIRE